MIAAGSLRHQIVIEQSTEAQSSFGEPTPTWSTLATTRASIEPLEGRELFTAQQVFAAVTHRVRLWYVAGVVAKMRVNFNGRLFDIGFVRNVQERGRELELLVKELV